MNPPVADPRHPYHSAPMDQRPYGAPPAAGYPPTTGYPPSTGHQPSTGHSMALPVPGPVFHDSLMADR